MEHEVYVCHGCFKMTKHDKKTICLKCGWKENTKKGED